MNGSLKHSANSSLSFLEPTLTNKPARPVEAIFIFMKKISSENQRIPFPGNPPLSPHPHPFYVLFIFPVRLIVEFEQFESRKTRGGA